MKISIVTVCYNCENNIEETIQSVIGQTYSNKEYVVIDGASTDATMSIVNKFRENINIVVSEPDNGIFDAMNKALEYVTGDYVLYLNAGDKFVDNYVIDNVFKVVDDDSDIVYGDNFVQTKFGYQLRKANAIYVQNPQKLDLVFKSQGICHQSIFTKTKMLRKIKFNTEYPLGADYDTTAQIYYAGNHKLRYAGIPISVFDDRTGGASHGRMGKVIDERVRFFDVDKNLCFYLRYLKYACVPTIKKIIMSILPSFVENYRKRKYVNNI